MQNNIRQWATIAVAAAIASAAATAGAQTAVGVSLGDVDGAAVLNALAQECYEAGMFSAMPSDSIMDCTEGGEEFTFGASDPEAEPQLAAVQRHKLRFTVLQRAQQGRIAADAWTETEELGTVIEEPVTSDEYLQRVQGVLTAVVARLGARGAPPWASRYDSEQAWHLDAHLHAVSHCNANLESMTASSVVAELESIGLRPLDEDTRDRCEQLYTHLFEWGLTRGDAEPGVQEYVRYRASLPPEQRLCSGQLAREASCRR